MFEVSVSNNGSTCVKFGILWGEGRVIICLTKEMFNCASQIWFHHVLLHLTGFIYLKLPSKDAVVPFNIVKIVKKTDCNFDYFW